MAAVAAAQLNASRGRKPPTFNYLRHFCSPQHMQPTGRCLRLGGQGIRDLEKRKKRQISCTCAGGQRERPVGACTARSVSLRQSSSMLRARVTSSVQAASKTEWVTDSSLDLQVKKSNLKTLNPSVHLPPLPFRTCTLGRRFFCPLAAAASLDSWRDCACQLAGGLTCCRGRAGGRFVYREPQGLGGLDGGWRRANILLRWW
jgi:hypothetical protein